MRLRILSAAVAGALLAPSVGLTEFAYTGLEVSYVDIEFDSSLANIDGDGYRLGGAIDVSDKMFVLGQWEEQSFDFGIDGSAYELGVGLHHALGRNLDFVGTASYVQAEIEAGGFSVDDDGLALGGGIRARLADSFELDAMLKWVDMDDSGSDTGIELRGRYYLSKRFAVLLATDIDDDVDTLSLGFRAEF
jgi:hypothetical protein